MTRPECRTMMAIGQCLVEEGIHMNEIAIIATEDPDEEAQLQALEKKGKDKEAEKLRVLSAIASNSPTRVIDRVAWILNHYPQARDSDVKCQILYWKTFQADLYSGGDISFEHYPKLQRLHSIARARAMVQNVLGLFIASPEVRKYRGKLEEEEKQRALGKLRTSQRRAADWRPNRFLARSSATDFTRNPAFDRVSAFYRRTSPVSASNSRRAIHRFDRANKVTSCAVFLARPRKRTLV